MQMALTHPQRFSYLQLAIRVLAAALLIFVGVDHYYEYSTGNYSLLPTIGTLFLLNFISATAIGLLLLFPLQRVMHRFGRGALLMVALSGFGIAATSLAGLLVSEQTTLFGWMEPNYRPEVLVAIASEAAAALCLGFLLVLTLKDRRFASNGRKASVRPSPAH